MRVIIRMEIPIPKSKKQKEEKTSIETVKDDKNQATIANFYPNKEK